MFDVSPSPSELRACRSEERLVGLIGRGARIVGDGVEIVGEGEGDCVSFREKIAPLRIERARGGENQQQNDDEQPEPEAENLLLH